MKRRLAALLFCGVLAAGMMPAALAAETDAAAISVQDWYYDDEQAPEAVSGFTVTNIGQTQNELTWSAVYDAAEYRISVKTSKADDYQLLVVCPSDQLSYTHKKLTLGVTYYYKIEAVSSSGMVGEAAEAHETVRLNKVTNVKTSMKSAKKMTLTWKKNSQADGYLVYRYKSEWAYDQPEYAIYRNVLQKDAASLTITVTNGMCYYYKIVPYQLIDGKKVKGREATKQRYADYYAYANENYSAKKKRIYGTNGSTYTKESTAKKNMVTISVKVWDFQSGMSGKKVTKTKYLTVHKNIAPTVKKIFQEIYNGDEKAPIYSIGGYSWRGGNTSSEHTQGLAIDINPEYNYFVNKFDGTIYSGNCWNPKKYAYSIKRNGDIENAFRKYGFYRGDWSTTADYMHFSYFGT